MTPLITVCIPTWQGEDVLEHAITCARNQTLEDIEIIIAVDQSTDRTAEIARAAATRDSRIRALVHDTRKGWTANVNSALNEVSSEYFSIYFHDDTIEPNFLEELYGLLAANPEAGSAFCCVAQDTGFRSTLDPGRDYIGSTYERLMDRLLLAPKGSPLRALTRRRILSPHLRFPEASLLGFHAQQSYLLELIAAAPSLYHPSVLYRRWNLRDGGLVRKWPSLTVEETIRDLKAVGARMNSTIERHVLLDEHKRHIRYAFGLLLMHLLRHAENERGATALADIDELLPGIDWSVALPEPWCTGAMSLAQSISYHEQRWYAWHNGL